MRGWATALAVMVGCGPAGRESNFIDGTWSGPVVSIGTQDFDLYLEVSTAPCDEHWCAAGFWLSGVSGSWVFDCYAEVNGARTTETFLVLDKLAPDRTCALVLGEGLWHFSYTVSEDQLVLRLPRGAPAFQRDE